jgi:2-polyprenyl-3-methyl-5-hydroxy-6-metoxy-1,4-benzoquinol methylase
MSIFKTRFNQQYFQNILYREKPGSQRNALRVREVRLHKENGKLLELGCAEGNFLLEARKHFTVTGCDISRYAIHKAKQLVGSTVHVMDVEKEPLPKKHYDIIAVFNLLEHLKNPQHAVRAIYTTLKNGGVLVGSVPNNSGIIGSLVTRVTNIFDTTHCSTLTPDAWINTFQNTGFKEIIFFGEIQAGRNHAVYIKNKFWRYISFNLMFVCKKTV